MPQHRSSFFISSKSQNFEQLIIWDK
jgi:hypothetical protein